MSVFLDPVYLNEKMVMNCAAYLFKGVALESEESQKSGTEGKAKLKLGLKFLTDYFSPVSAEGEIAGSKATETRATKRYTLGGIHMTVLDALHEEKHLIPVSKFEDYSSGRYVDVEAVLKPVDFYSILDLLKTLTPFVIQLLRDFGPKFKKDFFNKQVMDDLKKYGESIPQLIQGLEDDYLKSKQLEMIMIDPTDLSKQIGIVDLDVSDYDPVEVKSKLTDGRFHIIGKVINQVNDGESMSLLKRSFLSVLFELIEKMIGLSKEIGAAKKYHDQMMKAQPFVNTICQLNVNGPAVRLMAMSVCA